MESNNLKNSIHISAVIPAYNAEKYIARAIDSVLNQTHPVDEIVVVDDGSTDGTASIIKSYGNKVQYIYQQNAGECAARNAGIKAAVSEWIAFLDADDEWLPRKIEQQTENLNKYPDLVWTTGNYYKSLCEENRRAEHYPCQKIKKLLRGKEYFDSYFTAWQYSLWGCSDMQMIRRDVLIQVGLFPVDQKIAGDIDTWLRVAYLHPKVGFVAEPLAVYHLDNPRSSLQRYNTEQFHANFVERHFRLAEQAGMTDTFRPAAAFMMRRWIRSMLFSRRKDEIRELLERFSHCFSLPYRCLIYIATLFPALTAFCLQMLSRVTRVLKLRRYVTRRPPNTATS